MANGFIFWTESEEKDGSVTISFDKTKLIDFLDGCGFNKMYLGKEKIYVKETDNILEEVTAEQIQDFVVNFVRNLPAEILDKATPKELESALIENTSYLFGGNAFSLLREFKKKPLRDTATSAFFTFNNCVVEITGSKILLHPYEVIDSCIWKKQIINHDFNLGELNCDFQKFLINICGGENERYKALLSTIGYLLHSFKDPSKTKCVILCDEDSSHDLEGRTGKSLVVKAIGKLRDCLTIDGKNSKVNETFSFQQVELSTQIINFNDVNKNFNFESLFSIITEGLKVEKKYRESFFINFEDAPKIVITTNHTVQGRGDSFEDRMHEIEFSSHYSKDHKPKDEFGRNFFGDWDKEEWNRFHSFMLACVRYYLQFGLQTYPHINLPNRKLIDEYGEVFFQFMLEVEFDLDIDKRELFERFVAENDGVIPFGQRTFTSMIRDFGKAKNIKVDEWKSNGKSLIKLTKMNE